MFSLLFTALLVVSARSAELANRQAPTKGDTYCGSTVCVSATVNGSSIDYVLSSTGRFKRVGWMAVGFGYSMLETPMVIAWANPDGSMTLSQRQASSHSMPTVVDDPPRITTPFPERSQLTGSKAEFAFSVPLPEDGYMGARSHIYAMSTTRPSSSAADAHIVEHDDVGIFNLDLTKDLVPPAPAPSASSSQKPTPTNTPASSPPAKKPVEHNSSPDMPYTSYQRLIIAHAIFASVGFLVLLPLGVLLARYLRTFTPMWFKIHWMVQVAVAGPVILIGAGLGMVAVDATEGLHLNDGHKKWGAVLFALYLGQALLGLIVHSSRSPNGKRLPRNYVHCALGLTTVALAFKQVWSGYRVEWKYATGRSPLPASVGTLFWVWLGVLSACYIAGLGLLRRQFRQERQVGIQGTAKEVADAEEVRLEARTVTF